MTKSVQGNMGLEGLKKYYVKKKYSMGSKPQCLQDQMGRTGHMEGLEKTLSSWRTEISYIF